MNNTTKINKAINDLYFAMTTVMKYSHGHTADFDACKRAFDSLREAGVGLQAADRIAVEEWEIPPTMWARVRGVQAKSLGCYDKRVRNRIPAAFKLTAIFVQD